ncbi:uncharacterized protein CFAP92 isoform X2 [Anolis carolinensis]
MASHSLDIEEEGEYVDCSSPHSESTYETESPEACGGGYPTPEDETMACCYSVRSQELDPEHIVTCTFSVSLALPLAIQTPKRWSRQETQRTSPPKTREGFIPKMHRFYHIEYFLLPDDTDPRKLDLVLLGSLARLYLETESRSVTPKDGERPRSKRTPTHHTSAVKPWLENDQIWVSWSHSIEINVTNEFLIKLRDHNIQLRLWDLKEKVCSKARFGKQKPAVPHSDHDFEGAVKRTVLYQRDYVERNKPKPSRTIIKTEGHIEQEKPAGSTSAARPTSGISNQLETGSNVERKSFPRGSTAHSAMKSEEDNQSDSMVSFSGSIPSSLKERTIQEAKVIKQKLNLKPCVRVTSSAKSAAAKLPTHGATHGEKNESVAGVLLQLSERRKTIHKISVEKKPVLSTHRSFAKEAAAQAALARKFGIAFLELSLMPLLTGERYVASQLKEKSFKLFDAYLSFSVDNALMTEKQKRELNPLIIRIKSARGLPATPVPIEVLQSSCVPVYCKYKFHNMPPHQTQGRDHGTEVFFKDMNVILIGTLKPEELSEYLRGPPLEIEVHDRDKKMEAIKTKPSLFGEEPGDSKLSNLSFSNINFRYMLQSSFSEEIWHPYGVARISLVDLLLGEKTLNFIVPIQNCSVQDTAVCQGENIAEKDRGGDGSQVIQLPMGHYVNAESHLKVRVEITVPLSPEDELDDSETSHCPYGCIIYIFDYKNTSLLSYLLEEITKINAEALQLDSYPLPIILQYSLNTLKLDHKLPYEDVSQLDIITGFHILDGSIHLLVLEGLKNKGLKKLWNKKIDRLQEAKRGRLQIFYNSQLSFHQRLYTDLEAIVFHIRLCKSLTSIMKHPLLYIRDMVPQPCFEALVRLDYICQVTRLRDVIHHNLLPSAEMITILSREFGIPLGEDDLFIEQYTTISDKFNIPVMCLHRRRDMRSPLDNQNEEYILRKREMENRTPQDYIQGNIENLNLFNKMMRREVPQTIRAFPSDGKSIFNYSCQALNSAEITKNLLRVEMAKVPGQRFAYSHNYISAIFAPVDEDIARKASMEQSRKQWLSPEGFVCAGFKSSIESNCHPRMPDEARQMELKEKWQENFFNAGRLKPVLDRERWSWDKRNDDFELYKKPPLPAVTFDTHREEPKKEICCNTALKVYRRWPGTELIVRGPKASCQLDRFQDLLKDKPMKLSLKMQPTPVAEKFDEVVEVRFGKGYVPGDDPHRGLMANINIIPCYDRQNNFFKTLKGADFRTVCYKHSFQHKMMPSKQAAFKDQILPEDVHDAVPQKKDSVTEV